jgi:hypothetical protein
VGVLLEIGAFFVDQAIGRSFHGGLRGPFYQGQRHLQVLDAKMPPARFPFPLKLLWFGGMADQIVKSGANDPWRENRCFWSTMKRD